MQPLVDPVGAERDDALEAGPGGRPRTAPSAPRMLSCAGVGSLRPAARRAAGPGRRRGCSGRCRSGKGAEGDGAGARRVEPVVAVLPPQAHDAEHGPVPLLGGAGGSAGCGPRAGRSRDRPSRPSGGGATASTRRGRGGHSACARRRWTAARRSGAGGRSHADP